MAQDDVSLELERALRRVRSTGDLGFETPAARASRHRNPRSDIHPPGREPRIDSMHDAGSALPAPASALTRDGGTRGQRTSLDQLASGHTQFADLEPATTSLRRRRPTRPVPDGVRGKVLVFFGLAGPNAKARSALITVLWKLAWGFVQVRPAIDCVIWLELMKQRSVCSHHQPASGSVKTRKPNDARRHGVESMPETSRSMECGLARQSSSWLCAVVLGMAPWPRHETYVCMIPPHTKEIVK